MDRNEFRKRMQDLKSYRQNNPDKGYWDWKVQAFAEGGEAGDEKQKRYIGGSTDEARKQYLEKDKKLQRVVNDLASQYGISPELLFYRLSKEGAVDLSIRAYNRSTEPIVSLVDNNYNNLGNLTEGFGLDDIFSNYKSGKVKTNRPIRFTQQSFTNEHGRATDSGTVRNNYDAIELLAADLASRQETVLKDFPNLNSQQLNAAVSAYYNAGETGGKKLVSSGKYNQYTVPEYINDIQRNYQYNELAFPIEGIDVITTPTRSINPYLMQESNVFDDKYWPKEDYEKHKDIYNQFHSENYDVDTSYYNPYLDIPFKFAEGGEVDDKQQQITNAITYALNRGNVDAAKSLMRRGTPNTNYYYPQSGAIDPVFSLYDTPVLGDAMTTTDAARYAMNGDWANAGLAMAGLILPGVVGKGIKKVNRHIPSVKGYKESVENQINRIMDPQDLQKQSDWNNMLYRSAEQVYEPDVINRAAATGTTDRLNRVRSMYENDLENMPKIRMTDELNGARGRVQLTKEAEQRYRQGIKPSDSDFEILVDRNIDPTQEVIDHELRHWNQYMEQGSPNINVMPTSTRSGVRPTSKNKLDPNHSDYYGKQGESEAYILNAYRDMKQKGYQINLKNFKKYYNSLKDIDTKKRAISQFSSLEDAYKWMQSMPLIGTAGVIAMNNKEQSN